MSLTSQLKDKSSPVRLFFEAHSEPSGMLRCLTRDLQSTKAILPPSFKSTSKVAPSFTGTTTDYIIRYLLQNNRLKFEDSFAYAVTQSRPFAISMANQRIVKPDFFSALFDIGKFFLDGRNAAEDDVSPIFSSTRL